MTSVLPRRFALVRHVDYTGVAGTGVIAYGVAFDDGQVVLRWNSAHRATSVLDSVEDLIAVHGHGEATSIEWVDAPPGQADDAPAHGGRRAKRPPNPEPLAEGSASPSAEPADVRPSPGPAPADTTPRPVPDKPSPVVVAATSPGVPTSPADAATPDPAQVQTSDKPRTASPAAAMGSYRPPADTAPVQPQPGPAPASDTAPVALPEAVRPTGRFLPDDEPSGVAPYMPAPSPLLPPSLSSPNGSGWPSAAASGDSRDAQAGEPPARAGRRRAHDDDAEIDRPAADVVAARPSNHHAAIATQPMKGLGPPKRAQRTPESPRSIFDETEDDEPKRPDLRLARSNGHSGDLGDHDAEPEENRRESFRGFFTTGHQHLETVTGLLDLPAGFTKRGRGNRNSDGEDDVAARRNGRHRGE